MKPASNIHGFRFRAVIVVLAITVIAAFFWRIGSSTREEKPILSPEIVRPLEPAVVGRPDDASLSQMNPDLLGALGMQDNLPQDARVIMIRQFQNPLSENEVRLLFHLLLQGPSSGESPGWYAEYMHEICRLLRRSKVDQPLFASVLAAIASDSSRDETIRDYSLQHLRFLWEVAEAGLRARIVASMEAMALEQSALAPSALLSLHVLGSSSHASWRKSATTQKNEIHDHFGFPDEAIKPTVAGILATPPQPANTAARMAAVRIIRERKMQNHLPELRRMAADGSEDHAVVRMACIAAIAELGAAGDIAFLESLDRRDPRIDSALRHSINNHP